MSLRIGIFGGTFNPVHSEHVVLSKYAIEKMQLDKLFIMPTFLSPHKTLLPASATDRLNMLNLAFKNVDKVEVCDYEIKKEGKSYTYETAEEFRKRYKDAEIFLFIGEDMLIDFKTWKYPERILNAVNLCVFYREGFTADEIKEREYFRTHFNKDYIRLDYKGKNYSSSKIRIYSAFSLPLEGICIKEVEEYIKSHGLFTGDKYVEYIKKVLPYKRLKHTADVVICALKKAKELSLKEETVMTACTLHDCAKYEDYTKYGDFVLPKDIKEPVIHAYLGAYIAQHVLNVKDKEIIDAIRYHTSGRAKMSDLEKLVFTADMVEEGRNYEGVEQLREEYEKDFITAFKMCLKEETLHLKNGNKPIYIETLNAYDYYIKNDGR